MIKFADLNLPPSFESAFDHLYCLLNCFPDGRKFLNGDDSPDQQKVMLELERYLDRDPFYSNELYFDRLKILNDVLNQIIVHYKETKHFKKIHNLRFPVQQEKNLLGEIIKNDIQQTALDDILKLMLHEDTKSLTNNEKIGLLAIRLGFECGVVRDKEVYSIIRTLASKMTIYNIESIYFIDYPIIDTKTKTTYFKRVILSPLTFSFMCDSDFLDYLQSNQNITLRKICSERLKLIRSKLKNHLAETYQEAVFKQDLKFFAVKTLPSFLAQVSNTNFRSYCLSLTDFARLHGVFVSYNDQPFNEDEFTDDDDDDDEDNKKGRKINVRYFSEADLKRLLHFIKIHPTVSDKDYKRFALILFQCFYLGLRRSEALFLRHCDVFPVESRLCPASVFIRKTNERRLKTTNSTRHQPLSLLPTLVCENLKQLADKTNENLLIGRSFNKMSSQHFFDRLNRLMAQCLGSGFVLHTCRHSFISHGILLSIADGYNFDRLETASTYIREVSERSRNFRHSFRLPETTQQHLTNVSQSAGHSRVETTLTNYLHSTEIVSWSAMCANRPEGYLKAVAASSGVSLRNIQRWNEDKKFQSEVMNHVAKKCNIIKRFATPIPEIDKDTEDSFNHYKKHYHEELSGRELREWVRFYKALANPKAAAIVERLKNRLNSRGQFVINNKEELRIFKSSCTQAGINKSFWEARASGGSDKCFYPFSDIRAGSNFPIFVRANYMQNNLNAPRRILKLLIETF